MLIRKSVALGNQCCRIICSLVNMFSFPDSDKDKEDAENKRNSLLALTQLVWDKRNSPPLDKLQYCINLEILSLYLVEIYSLSSIGYDGGLTSADLENIQIHKLVKLQELDINVNRITDVPYSIGNLVNLTKLDLANNMLRELPWEIGCLTQLTYQLDQNYVVC